MKYVNYLNRFPSLEGKYYIVTGANSGLGFDTSLYLAYKGANVILVRCKKGGKSGILFGRLYKS